MTSVANMIVNPYEGVYRATIPSARLTACGATRREARRNVEDLASATIEICAVVGPDRFGTGPAGPFKAQQTILGAR
jgi:hypothetical protein